MLPRDKKKGSLRQKFELLRSVTNSQAVNKTSIVSDASKYIMELKQKVQSLNEDMAITSSSQNLTDEGPFHRVTVETLESGGFVINVYSEKSTSGLLVSILEAFEELGLNVLQARVSCTDTFHLEAVGGENDGKVENVDAEMVKQAVMASIRKNREANARS